MNGRGRRYQRAATTGAPVHWLAIPNLRANVSLQVRARWRADFDSCRANRNGCFGLYNFHVSESRKVSRDLFLHRDGEKCRFIAGTEIFEWEHSNGTFRLSAGPCALVQ